MQSLDEKEWKPIKISDIFETIKPGKISQANQFEKVSSGGVNYVAATNRNNGVLYQLEPSEDLKKKVQAGNCIGFIKDGDGSAGYAIYKHEPFASTVNVIYGYADWLNCENGLFFVAAQDMIEDKYSHGYKRNLQHLRGDKVMLPVTDSGEPDYEYMAKYTRQKRETMLNKYFEYVEERIAEMEHKGIPALDEKEWKPILISSMFELVRGRENNMAMLEDGDTPLISAKANNNGLKGFVHNPKKIIIGQCITLNNDGDGGAGLAYYQPANMALDSHVTALVPLFNMSTFSMLFIAKCISGLHGFFGHGLSISNPRAKRLRIMLPIDDSGEPDYAYMEQYSKNMMLRKYKQYLEFINRQNITEVD